MRRWSLILILILFLVPAGSVLAAEFVEEAFYELAENEVVADDLYVSAGELIIDGQVQGDVIFFGSYIEVNGQIEGDLIAIAPVARLSGQIQNDVRLLTASVVVDGQIEGDLLTTGAGGGGVDFAPPTGSRPAPQGVFLTEGIVGGDVLLATGLADLSGTIGGQLRGVINNLVVQELLIREDVDVQLATLSVDEDSRVEGEDGFAYRAFQPLNVPTTLTENIVFNQIERPGIDWLTRLRQAAGATAGFALLGYILLRYRPQWLIAPASVMTRSPGRCFFIGFLAGIAGLAVSFVLILVVGLFWGPVGGLAAGGILFLGLVLLWIASPLIAAIWIGQRFSQQPFQAMLIGVVILVILTLIPQVGFGFALITFAIALGALVLAPRMTQLPSQV